jgi:hypothetical protein
MFDPERVLRLLNDAGATYLVIGGIAGNLHGCDRATAVLDLCYERSRENIQRLVRVLTLFNAHPRGWPEGVPFILDDQTIVNGDSFTFSTEAGDLHILGTPSGSDGYLDLARGAERMEIDPGFVIAVVGLDDLIRLKRAAARQKDLADLPDLERLRELRESAP